MKKVNTWVNSGQGKTKAMVRTGLGCSRNSSEGSAARGSEQKRTGEKVRDHRRRGHEECYRLS